ncbi:hypothetical protein BSQ44_19065 [Aquibium oceanicum]|uniref:EAL domain-containing protein n=1 Tax=Aquibium oceanicum TaxID=1670800 RepID=A0A1L3SV30_9HYPH|nr:hypothetical protein BSQ44_19065 [Aquibium oceanicum]
MARAAFAAAFLGACVYGARAVTPEAAAAIYPSQTAILIVASLLSACALALACMAFFQAQRQAAEFTRFSRSIEIALSRLSAQVEAGNRAVEDIETWVGEELSRLSGSNSAPSEPADTMQNIVQHPSAKKSQGRKAPAPAGGGQAENALAEAVSSGALELSLQPIISIARNAAVGFDTFAHLEIDGAAEDIYRLSSTASRVDRAAFERLLVTRAAETARRRLGPRSGSMPLHCPISEALLDDETACEAVSSLISSHPALSKSIVLSLGSALLREPTPVQRERLSQLLQTGISFAAEGWDGPAGSISELRDLGVVFLKLDANRLLDREKSRRKQVSGRDLAVAGSESGLEIIATGIMTDEDAVNILDLGVDLMIGDRFSEPKRLRSTEAAA